MPASIYTLPSCSSFFFAELVFEANVTSQNGIWRYLVLEASQVRPGLTKMVRSEPRATKLGSKWPRLDLNWITNYFVVRGS
jgi:hypothetical protein